MKITIKLTFLPIVILIFAISVNSLHLLSQQHRRQISKQCCKIKGGFQCGTTFKDCCAPPPDTTKQNVTSELCVKGGLFNSSEYCPGEKITEPCNYCQKQCQQKKGTICGLSNGQSDQCCLKQDCIPDIDFNLKMKKCKPGKQIQLSDCVTDLSLADSVFGKVENIV